VTPNAGSSALGSKSGLKPGVPMPRVRLPENFVDRPSALSSVKEKLLVETGQTLVVSAIAGLGGLGKSVLATAIVLDAEVQQRFEDGILWVTLGQNPDLQSYLGDWIRELDKSRDSFSATTLESARGYLHNLLAERRMLLVVDDVWNAAHAEWFRVGGAGCRVLVTTREAQIEGAEVYPLALMSEGEAIDLVRRKLGRLWKVADEGEVRSFAKVLGYLPLALDLAANLVRDGLGWGELQAEFEDERRAVLLEILDTSESFELMSEKDREKEERKHSLKACFNLSLKRLSPVQLRQFAWLGVLPEDVDLSGTIAEVLWDVKPIWAKRGLSDLRNRSFLTDGVQTFEGVATYRVHDLMHDTARGLIEKGELGIENLEIAHGAFLERYRGRSDDGSWYGLANDGYIHRHLTWHLEMAGQLDAVHELMASGEDQNDWFEACDKIGQPGIFVEDVRRGWRLAEELYESDRGRAIVLQCRYSLITGTLNSLLDNLPVEMMVDFVKGEFWSMEQAWAYVEQMQDETKITQSIALLAPYLPKSLLVKAVVKAQSVQVEDSRALSLIRLAQIDNTYSTEALENARSTQYEYSRDDVLENLARINDTYFGEDLENARSISGNFGQVFAVIKSIRTNNSDFSPFLRVLRHINNRKQKTAFLCVLGKYKNIDYRTLLEESRCIQDEFEQILAIGKIGKITHLYVDNALKNSQEISDENLRARILCELVKNSNADCSIVFKMALSLQLESNLVAVLREIVKINNSYCSIVFKMALSFQSESNRAIVLREIVKIDNSYYEKVLEAANSIQDENSRAIILISLTMIKNSDFHVLLSAAQPVKWADREAKADILIALATMENADFDALLLDLIDLHYSGFGFVDHYELNKALILSKMVKADSSNFNILFQEIKGLSQDSHRTIVLCQMIKINHKVPELLKEIQIITDKRCQLEILISLASVDNNYFLEAVNLVRAIQNKEEKLEQLVALARIDNTFFHEALEVVKLIRDEFNQFKGRHINALINLSKVNNADFDALLEVAVSIQEGEIKDSIMSRLTENASSDFLPKIYPTIIEISHPQISAKVLSSYISRLPLDRLPYTDWTTYLHLLAHRTRADLMGDLATLYPAILHLGGDDAGRGIVGEMGRICKQWK
jgi:hypothetical protein